MTIQQITLSRDVVERAENALLYLIDEHYGDRKTVVSNRGRRAIEELRAALAQLEQAEQRQEAVGNTHFPERDPSQTAEQQGVFRKFIVQRVDGSDKPGGKHDGCEYFVLDVDHDPHAKAALAAYAKAVAVSHPVLAEDMLNRYKLSATTPAPQALPTEWAKFIHYPECWDTAAYPTLESAAHEALAFAGCSVHPHARQALPWVGLSEEKINEAGEKEDNETAFLVGWYNGARWAESLLREKNARPPAAQPAGEPSCSNTLRLLGKPYPRTCKLCGLGPCKSPTTAQPFPDDHPVMHSTPAIPRDPDMESGE